MAKLQHFLRNILRRDRIKRELDDEVATAFDLLVEEKERMVEVQEETRKPRGAGPWRDCSIAAPRPPGRRATTG